MGQFEDFFKEELSKHANYDGLFFPKSRYRTMGEYERRQVDGCATLYKTNK
jgi:CCR4-NOT transcription complex subunit 6